ncbi:MAG: purine-nucleoside phosphorylase [Bacilli bacterium]
MMTPHNKANKEDIKETVIMPGDPKRAKMIAEKYLTDHRLVSDVRGIYAYTGKYKGHELTVMASGMGIPSMGIYSYELYKFYNVKNIIRVGSCGSYSNDLNLRDIVLVNDSYSESTYAKTQNGCNDNLIKSSYKINFYIKETADQKNLHVSIANIHSSDVFYKENDNFKEIKEKYGCLACEMESFSLFHNAHVLGTEASCLLTVSDSLVNGQKLTTEERENSFNQMIELALESAIKL